MTFTTPAIDDAPIAGSADPAIDLPVEAALSHAVVGLGRFGSTHARKLAGLPGFRLRAVVDRSPTVCSGVELAALPLLCSVDDLPPDIESATVATSDEAHAEVALALMRRGCHVLVEKPLCIDQDDGALMIRTARQCGVTLSTGHIERFNPALDDSVLRRLRHAAVEHRHGAQPILRFRRYSSRDATARDSVLDLMVHDIDLFAWLCAIPVDAPLEVITRHIGARSVHARVRLGDLVADLESGYAGMLASAEVQVCIAGHQQVLDLRSNALHMAAGDDALARQYQDFRRAIRGEGKRIASGVDGLVAVTRACQVLHA
jgi:predicted dehydrogenase